MLISGKDYKALEEIVRRATKGKTWEFVEDIYTNERIIGKKLRILGKYKGYTIEVIGSEMDEKIKIVDAWIRIGG